MIIFFSMWPIFRSTIILFFNILSLKKVVLNPTNLYMKFIYFKFDLPSLIIIIKSPP